jgi:hypothetical protein
VGGTDMGGSAMGSNAETVRGLYEAFSKGEVGADGADQAAAAAIIWARTVSDLRLSAPRSVNETMRAQMCGDVRGQGPTSGSMRPSCW